MYKGTNEITNKGLGFKLTNSMSFGESVISARYIQKTIKEDLHVIGNHGIPLWELRGKTLEDSRRLSIEAGHEALPCGAGQPHLQAAQPPGPPVSLPAATSVSHRLLGYISAIP
jgi:hypothetical protein